MQSTIAALAPEKLGQLGTAELACPIGRIVRRPGITATVGTTPIHTTVPIPLVPPPQNSQTAQVRALEVAPAGTPGSSVPVTAPTVVQPAVLPLYTHWMAAAASDRPERFSGQRRDWRRFWRQFEKYDRDLSVAGQPPESLRVKILEGLLDKAGQCKVATLQKEAEARGVALTVAEVKAQLDLMLETAGAYDARAEIRASVPDWAGGRPAGPAWRDFAEEFRMICAQAPEVPEEEKKEHLMSQCLTQQLAQLVMNEDRKRGKQPKATLVGFGGISPVQVKTWLTAQGVDTRKITCTNTGHMVVCESKADHARLLALDNCHVEVSAGIVALQVRKVDTALSVFEILDLITEKLADEELYNDTRRAASRNSQGHNSQSGQLGHSRRQVRAVEAEGPSDDDDDASWAARVAAVDTRGPGQAQGPQGSTSKSPSNHNSREAGKGAGKAHGGNASRSNSQSSHDGGRDNQQAGKGPSTKGGGKGANSSNNGPQDNSADGCWQCGGPHLISNCPLIECWSCGQVGHPMARCPNRQSKGKGGGKGGRGPRPSPQ